MASALGAAKLNRSRPTSVPRVISVTLKIVGRAVLHELDSWHVLPDCICGCPHWRKRRLVFTAAVVPAILGARQEAAPRFHLDSGLFRAPQPAAGGLLFQPTRRAADALAGSLAGEAL